MLSLAVPCLLVSIAIIIVSAIFIPVSAPSICEIECRYLIILFAVSNLLFRRLLHPSPFCRMF